MVIADAQLKSAPVFDADFNTGIETATIYAGNYERLMAVIDAARTGNQTLIKLALALLDEKGSSQ